jgi:copper resistance protein B
LFISEDGDVSLRGELEYDLLLTQRLILQPSLELNASASDVPEHGVGSGFGSTEAGIRLRYEIRRELAPYIGVRWEQLYGDTRDLARDHGEPTSSTSLVVGIKAWF